MPLTIRDKESILANEIHYVLAGNIVTDVNQISVTRQLLEGSAASIADLYYDLYVLLQGWYLTTAEGVDLDIRGLDYGVARDPGQAASDPVTFSRAAVWMDDIALASSQAVQATLADGTEVLYRSLGEHTLTPCGRSISGQAPGVALTGGVNDRVTLTLDGDGPQTVSVGTWSTGVQVAAALEAAVRALTALTPSQQPAYTTFRCDYGVTNPGAYTLRSGTAGPSSSVVVTPAATADATHTLKLGLMNGGLESVGASSLAVPVQCDQIGVIGNVGAGQINTVVGSVPGIAQVANPLMFANGREPASDDAYRQDIRSYLDSLGRGNPASVERAVAHTVSADGARHVMSSQCVYGASTIAVYVCDGRSLTVGAQPDVIQDVQDELDGLGEEVGGWIPSGNTAGVVSAQILTIDIDVDVFLGTTPDLFRARQAIAQALYSFLYMSGVGQTITAILMDGVIDQTVVEVFNILYRDPVAFAVTPRGPIGGSHGVKPMPGRIRVQTHRA